MKKANGEFTTEARRHGDPTLGNYKGRLGSKSPHSPLCPRVSVVKSVRTAASWLALSLLAIVFALPFLWMVTTSLKGDRQVFAIPMQWVPRPVHWENYPTALAAFPFWRYLGNTLLLCAASVAGNLVSCAPPAYAFARLQFRGREALFILMLCTIMLPAQATMLPVFLLFRWLGWIGTFRPLWVPAFFGNAFFIFLLRQFFRTIPRELSDAARIDGCGEIGIFWRVVLPLAKPALATVALFTFIGTWTDYLGPLVYLHDERQFTLALGLTAFLGRHGAEWNYLMAASTVVTAPLIVLFFLTQRTFVKGVALTGLKG
jgi:multiple sugar transport system permease protein